MHATGLLLAAGAGRRMGRPKALMRDPDGTAWLTRSVRVLLEGGCEDVLVVLGASADQAERVLAEDWAGKAPSAVRVVRAERWSDGMSASLVAGLAELAELADGDAEVAVVHLVDLPDVGPGVVARLLAAATVGREADQVLARAAYGGVPGHPVLLGRAHWPMIAEQTHGDQGARRYLAGRAVTLLECGDLAGGADRDTPA
ncbi:nucleotidyltransferase family protein [Nocardioides insulae]|uniref:nucleotidyltransferase family protein n=1 Tax=Nocardioides insulae TaxID=394734 RepID=UPI00040F3A8C|nr:nucleotidyltransferase family protein [Nocardioides insulae]